MNLTRSMILALSFLSLCLISACRTTEPSIRDIRSSLAQESQLVSDRIKIEDGRAVGNRHIQWVMLAAIALGGVIMVFSSDRAPAKKAVPARRKSRRRKK